MTSFYPYVKRGLDIVGAFLGLLVLAPVLAVCAFLVRVRMGKPILFTQERAGEGGKPFVIYKFRTMRTAAGETSPEDDEERITSIGQVLRDTTLDELPELWNVLKGDMSLVGPRPLFYRYVDRYDEEQARRLEVKPGLTSWAVVRGRNALSWEERFELDVWYVDNRSLTLDLKIILITVWKILKREGVSHEDHATMPEFMGTESNGTRGSGQTNRQQNMTPDDE